MEDTTRSVVVIGAGISGLCAATLLNDAGLHVVVLEARDRVGGRTYTLRDPKFGYTDVGGAYIGPTQRRVKRLIKNLGLQTYKVNEEEKTVASVTKKWWYFHGVTPNVRNPFVANVVRTIDKMAKQVPVDAPWTAKKAAQWDSMTVKEFIDQTVWTDFVRSLAILTINAVLSAEPHEVSLLYYLWLTNTGNGFHRMTRITGGAQESKIIGGSQQLCEIMAGKLPGNCIKMADHVVKIKQADDKVTITTANGNIYHADYVISAMPQTLLSRVSFDPPLLGLKADLTRKFHLGNIIKTTMFYRTAFWRELELSGQMITDSGPVHYSIDDTKPDGSHPCIMGFIMADKSREMASMTTEERKHEVKKHYASVFKCDKFLDPVHYADKNWLEEEFSRGCVCTLPPGVLTKSGYLLRMPFYRIYFAGTESATCWAGYMDGAIQSGERSAREILFELGLISASEIHQEEPLDEPELPVEEHPLERIVPSVSQFLWIGASFVAILAVWLYNTQIKLS